MRARDCKSLASRKFQWHTSHLTFQLDLRAERDLRISLSLSFATVDHISDFFCIFFSTVFLSYYHFFLHNFYVFLSYEKKTRSLQRNVNNRSAQTTLRINCSCPGARQNLLCKSHEKLFQEKMRKKEKQKKRKIARRNLRGFFGKEIFTIKFQSNFC